MGQSLRDPILFPNWVWLLGVFLILVGLVLGLGLWVAYRRSRVKAKTVLLSLSQARQNRYRKLVSEVEEGFYSGNLDPREAHLALSSIIRAAATERLGRNVESMTIDDIRMAGVNWPGLVEALEWCEEPSFSREYSEYADNFRFGLQTAIGVIQQ